MKQNENFEIVIPEFLSMIPLFLRYNLIRNFPDDIGSNFALLFEILLTFLYVAIYFSIKSKAHNKTSHSLISGGAVILFMCMTMFDPEIRLSETRVMIHYAFQLFMLVVILSDFIICHRAKKHTKTTEYRQFGTIGTIFAGIALEAISYLSLFLSPFMFTPILFVIVGAVLIYIPFSLYNRLQKSIHGWRVIAFYLPIICVSWGIDMFLIKTGLGNDLAISLVVFCMNVYLGTIIFFDIIRRAIKPHNDEPQAPAPPTEAPAPPGTPQTMLSDYGIYQESE